MAIYNEILVARFARGLQKLFGMKGPPPVRQLAGEVAPAFPLFSGRENRYLMGWETFAIRATVPAGGVGNLSVARFRNPAGSGVIVVLESILIANQSAAADQPSISLASPPDPGNLSTSVASVALDPRGRTASSSIVSFKNNSAVGVTGTVIRSGAFPANGTYESVGTDIQEIPCLPGEAYDIGSLVTNQQLLVSLIWRERPLDEGELK